MSQIPILSGTYTDEGADFRTSYPVNLTPVPKDSGISKGYLRPADGIVRLGSESGPGVDRGGINWKGSYYRVMGAKLTRISESGGITIIGDIGAGGQVTFDYSFDRLAVTSGGNLYYLFGSALTQVTDQDLGVALTVVWVDGYFMTTDGTSLVVTDLDDPFAVNPLKYGSSEADPDPVVGLVKVQNEVYALNRHTIEVFNNVGGDLFPFQRIDGAQIQKGAIGTHACCEFLDAVAFVGSGRNEAPSIYIGSNSVATKIATREIDQILAAYTEAELSRTVLEKRIDKGHQHLIFHLPDRALVYDAAGSSAVQQPLWFVLTSSLDGFSTYRARNLVWCFGRWQTGDPTSSFLGQLSSSISSHFGEVTRWEFGTTIVYNEGRGAIFHELELVCLSGRADITKNPTISTSYSVDGESWSQEKFVSTGRIGDRGKRIVWLRQGNMRNWRIQRFRGTSDTFISVARLEAQLEQLAN